MKNNQRPANHKRRQHQHRRLCQPDPLRVRSPAPVRTLHTCLNDFVTMNRQPGMPLIFDDVGLPVTNFLAQGVREFFDNGGSLLFVRPLASSGRFPRGSTTPAIIRRRCHYSAMSLFLTVTPGRNRAAAAASPTARQSRLWTGRYPGVAGDVTLMITLSIYESQRPVADHQRQSRHRHLHHVAWNAALRHRLDCLLPSAVRPRPAVERCLLGKRVSEQSHRPDQLALSFPHRQRSRVCHADIALLPYQTAVQILKATVQITYKDTVTRTNVYPGVTFDPAARSPSTDSLVPVSPAVPDSCKCRWFSASPIPAPRRESKLPRSCWSRSRVCIPEWPSAT